MYGVPVHDGPHDMKSYQPVPVAYGSFLRAHVTPVALGQGKA